MIRVLGTFVAARGMALALLLMATLWARSVRAHEPNPTVAPPSPEVAALIGQVEALAAAGQYDAALPIQETILHKWRQERGPESLEYAGALMFKVRLLSFKGDIAGADRVGREAVAIKEKRLGPWHMNVAGVYQLLAGIVEANGDAASAEPLRRRFLRIFQHIDPNGLGEAMAQSELAQTLKALGRTADAAAALRKAIGIEEARFGKGSAETGVDTFRLAMLFLGTDNVRAEQSLRGAIVAFRKKPGAEANLAVALETLGISLATHGDYAQSEPMLREALALGKEGLPPGPFTIASMQTTLASVLLKRGDYDGAEELLLDGLGSAARTPGEKHPDLLDAASELSALLQQRDGDNAKAEKLLRMAVKLGEVELGPNDPRLGVPLHNLASLMMIRGDVTTAERLERRALGLEVRGFGWDCEPVAHMLTGLATLELAMRRPAAALADLERAADIQETLIATLVSVGSEREKRAFFSTLDLSTNRFISFHTRSLQTDARACRLALTTTLRRKGRVLDASVDSIEAVRRLAAPADRAKIQRLETIGAELGGLLRAAGSADPAATRKELDARRTEREALEKDLGDRYASLRPPQRPVTIEAVQAKLPPGAALIELTRYGPIDHDADGLLHNGPPRYVAYVLAPHGQPGWLDLGEAGTIDRQVAAVRAAFANPRSGSAARDHARRLDELVMRPLRAVLGDTRELLIAPDGPLNLVPLGALVDERGQYLLSSYHISYLTSGRDLLRRLPPSHSGPVIVAHPDYGPDARCADKKPHPVSGLGDAFFCPLENAAEEGIQLSRIIPDARLYLGRAATESLVKGLHGPSLLHLTTHGFFLPAPDEIAGRAAPEPLPFPRRGMMIVPNDDPIAAAAGDPLLRSGIALAGANEHGAEGDGILTAVEAASLDLSGTKLVIVSACQSGSGTPTTGDGVYGLRRSFVLAGAESQVMTLWDIADQTTTQLMIDYHHRLARGAGRVEGLRQAQLSMLAIPRTSHPYYWAAFIASGVDLPLGE